VLGAEPVFLPDAWELTAFWPFLPLFFELLASANCPAFLT
jgi:hypothetical protein